jgi:Fusaric acid resistance protein-like
VTSHELVQRRSILDAAFRPNFAAVHWAFAVRASCGVATAIVLAMHFGTPLDALAAGMGAVGTAPSSAVGTYRARVLATLAAAFGMSSAAFIAGWAVHWTAVIVLAVAGSAYVYGVLSCFSEAAGAVGLQALLATIILGNIGMPSAAIAGVALSVLGGGAIQLVLLVLAWPIERRVTPNLRLRFDTLSVARGNGDTAVPPFGADALRIAVTVALAILIFRVGHIDRGFWIAMTAAIVLRPNYGATFAVGIAQLAGTIVGGAIAWLIAMLIPVVPAAHAGAAIAFAALGFLLFGVGRAYYAIAVTGFVIFLLSMVGLSEATAVVARIEATLIGAALALIVFALWPRTRPILRT